MKKNAPKILAVVLLSLVAVLMMVAGSGSLLEVFKKDAVENENLPVVDAVGNDNQNGTEELPPQVEQEVSIFPLPAQESKNYRYEQNLTLSNHELDYVHTMDNFSLVIFTHNTEEGAFKVPYRTQTIIKVDEKGSVLGCLSVKTGGETEYLNSKITSQGLVVAVRDEMKTYLYTLSDDFKEVELMELPVFTSLEVYAIDDGFLVFGASTSTVVYKIINNAIVASNLIQCGEIKEIYDFSNYYGIFSSSINGYSYIKLSSELKLISTAFVQNKSLLAVEPLVENGEQKFLVVEHTASGVEIVKHYETLSGANTERVGVGLAESVNVFINGESIFLLLKSSTVRLYLVDKQLSFTSSNNTTFQGITNLHDCYAWRYGYKVLYSKGENLILTNICNDGVITSHNFDLSVASAYITQFGDDNCALVLQTESGLLIVGIN